VFVANCHALLHVTNHPTPKKKNGEGLFHQYFEGLVKDIQKVVSVVCGNRRMNVSQHFKNFNQWFFFIIFLANYFIENNFKVGKTFDKISSLKKCKY
jgi:hypothetical protein